MTNPHLCSKILLTLQIYIKIQSHLGKRDLGVEISMAKYREYEIKDLHGRVQKGFKDIGKNQSENQDPEDKLGRQHRNDVSDGWLRGSGDVGATAYPNFDHRTKGGVPKKW
jgi:hypothetical protein